LTGGVCIKLLTKLRHNQRSPLARLHIRRHKPIGNYAMRLFSLILKRVPAPRFGGARGPRFLPRQSSAGATWPGAVKSERDRNNADSPRSFSGARRAVAAQFALGPRSRAAPASPCAGAVLRGRTFMADPQQVAARAARRSTGRSAPTTRASTPSWSPSSCRAPPATTPRSPSPAGCRESPPS
jgi:hypothetical protein